MTEQAQAQQKPTPAQEAAAEEKVIADQIEAAMKAGTKAEGVEKAKATKAEKKLAKAAEKPVEPEAEAASAEPEEPAEKPIAAGPVSRQRLREMVDSGDIEGAFEAAFGKKPADFNITSKRWEEWRKANQVERRKLREREEGLQGYEQKLRAAFNGLRPLEQARQAAVAGDYEKVLEIFGVDVSTFNRQLLGKRTGRTPEVERLEAELKAMRHEREQEKQALEEQRRAELVKQKTQEYLAGVAQELSESQVEEFAVIASRPKLMARVHEVLRQHYDRRNDVTIPVLEAAEIVRDELVEEFGEFPYRARNAGASAESGRGGSNLAKAETKVSKTLSQRGAAEASAPSKNGKQMTAAELADYYAAQHNAASGKAPVRRQA